MDNVPFEKRLAEAKRMLNKYSQRVPVIAVRGPQSQLADIAQKKFLVPESLTVGQFLMILRTKLQLDATQSIYLFTKSGGKTVLLSSSENMYNVYQQHRADDWFLYLIYNEENVFGH